MKNSIFNFIGYLITLVIIVAYFVVSFLTFDFAFDLISFLVNGGLMFVAAVIANSALKKQGMIHGTNSKKYRETLTAHLTITKKISSKISKLPEWLDKDYETLLKIGRETELNEGSLTYEEVFNEQGKLRKDFKLERPKVSLFKRFSSDEFRIYKIKRRQLRRALKYKVTHLTTADVLKTDKRNKDPNNFGKSKNEYYVKSNATSTVIKLFASLVMGSLSVGLQQGVTKEAILLAVGVVLSLLASSMFSMFGAWYFVTEVHRETIIDKINKLEEFDNSTNSDFPTYQNMQENMQDNV